jgi:beta-1,4-mannosyltransferase
MNISVFVLGEVGRSPRMQYHALSLSKLENVAHVDLIGLGGSDPHPEIMQNTKINTHFVNENAWNWIPQRRNLLLFLIFAPLKIILQTLMILWTLMTVKKPEYMLVQTPPAIPTLFLVKLVCFIRGTKLVLDWHNYGWSLLQLSLGKNILTKFIKYVEMLSGKTAHHHFCVSNEFKKDLATWGINATVLYDRPPAIFGDLTPIERHNMYCKISTVTVGDNEEKTPFSLLEDGKVIERMDRPGLIVSSTSWTKDEDFGILLEAIKIVDARTTNEDSFPNLEFIITGKGDEKERYENEMKLLKLNKCKIQTKWLLSQDYPKLLASSDLGICLHYSSSGLDLPMKIVDMFGARLPVCAIHYKTLPELVEDGKNGLIFHDSKELAKQIYDLFEKFPKDRKQLLQMRENLKEFQAYRWDDEWENKASAIFQ